MRLTAEAILKAPNFLNPCGDREVCLRGLQAPSIENLALLQDQYEVIDLSFNQIEKVSNFPQLLRLTTLNLSHNNISSINSISLIKNLPNLKNLILNNNKIKNFEDIYYIKNIKNLEMLCLKNNYIEYNEHYKNIILYLIPTLKYLDYNKITLKDRENMKIFFTTTIGKNILLNVINNINKLETEKQISKKKITEDTTQATTTTTTTSTDQVNKNEQPLDLKKLTPLEKKILKNVIRNAKTKEEVEEIERLIRTNTFDFSKYEEEYKKNEEDNENLKRKQEENNENILKKQKNETESYEINSID